MKKMSYDAEYNKVIADLDVKDFHAIAYVDPPKVVKAKVKREDAEICMHVFGGGRHKYTTLATNTEKRFFVPLTKGEWPVSYPRGVLQDLHYYLQKTEGSYIVGLAEKAVAQVKGDKNFIPLDKWMATWKPTKADLNSVKRIHVSDNDDVMNLLKRVPGIKDKILSEMVDEYTDMMKTKLAELPEILKKQVLEMKEIKEFKDKDVKFTKHVKVEYPLLEEMRTHTPHTSELTIYINAKYATKKGNK